MVRTQRVSLLKLLYRHEYNNPSFLKGKSEVVRGLPFDESIERIDVLNMENYERGRQFAIICKTDKLNPSLDLYTFLRANKYIT